MVIPQTIIDSVCIRECPTRWCCSIRHFSPPPVTREDIRLIQKTGAAEFYEETEQGFHLKCRTDGYCTFFDPEQKTCAVYPVRPPDCRIFPFDYFAVDAEHGQWVIWDCPFSRRMDEDQIPAALDRFETDPRYLRHILSSWTFGNEAYTPASPPYKHAPGFRRLRSFRIIGPGLPTARVIGLK
ncbi:MAG: YkgJ family cysteine cluster protein [Desulfococcaceae bacterium]